jgi:hypothetical protein
MALCRRNDHHAVHFGEKFLIICGELFRGNPELARRFELLVADFGHK